MQFITEVLFSLHPSLRIAVIFLIAVTAHIIVRKINQLTQWLFVYRTSNEEVSTKDRFALRYPRSASLISIMMSAVTFIIYFIAVGLIFKEFNISLKAYLASASVIGLAIGFGSQGFVQDIVIGLTLIFSDVLNIEDLVEISGQVGKVEKIGLRFTVLVNFYGQKIYIPNRNIGTIGSFQTGHVKAYVDIQIPDEMDEKDLIDEIKSISLGVYNQHNSIILSKPEILGAKYADKGDWKYLRIKFKLWPNQHALIETTFKQRVAAYMKRLYPKYMSWMITITYGNK